MGTSFSLTLPNSCATHISKNKTQSSNNHHHYEGKSDIFLVIVTWLDLLNSEKVEVPILTP